MLLIRIVNSLLLLTLVTACTSKSSASNLAKELKTVSSWAATAHMVGDAWIQGNVPKDYAKQTLETAQEELQKEMDTLSKLSIAPEQQRTVQDQLQHLKYTVGEMSTAVEQENRTAIAPILKQLSTQEQTISSFAKTAGGQP